METAFKCHLCSETFGSLAKLNAHIERHTENVCDSKNLKFQCNVCCFEFRKRVHLIDHMRKQTGERPFKCQVSGCEIAFKQESSLKNHIKYKHSDERPLKCDFPGCLHTTKMTKLLKQHKKLHSDERPLACPHSGCNYRAKRKDVLSRHTANVHNGSKAWTCSKCNYNTNSVSNLARHMIVHDGKNENIPCSMEGCEYKGKHMEAVKQHMRRHKTLLPFPVSGCGQYVPKEALKNHLKLHNPPGRASQCPLYTKYFPTLFRLQEHCVIHTNEKPLQCGHCKYEAAKRAHVKTHIASVHATIEFPFVVHLLDDRECLRCIVTLPPEEFAVHCKSHLEANSRTLHLTESNLLHLNPGRP